jgi:hypothetical protein
MNADLTDLEAVTAANLQADTIARQQLEFRETAAKVSDALARRSNEAYARATDSTQHHSERHVQLGRSVALSEAADAIRTAFDLQSECSICRRRHGLEVQHVGE